MSILPEWTNLAPDRGSDTLDEFRFDARIGAALLKIAQEMLGRLFWCHAYSLSNRINLSNFQEFGIIFVGSMTAQIVCAAHFKRNILFRSANLELAILNCNRTYTSWDTCKFYT